MPPDPRPATSSLPNDFDALEARVDELEEDVGELSHRLRQVEVKLEAREREDGSGEGNGR